MRPAGLDPRSVPLSRATGLAHVVSVSGFHVAVAAGACFVLLRWLLLRSPAVALHLDVRKLAAASSVSFRSAPTPPIAGGSVPRRARFSTYAAVLAALARSDRPPTCRTRARARGRRPRRRDPDVAADVSFELSFALGPRIDSSSRSAPATVQGRATRVVRGGCWTRVVTACILARRGRHRDGACSRPGTSSRSR